MQNCMKLLIAFQLDYVYQRKALITLMIGAVLAFLRCTSLPILKGLAQAFKQQFSKSM